MLAPEPADPLHAATVGAGVGEQTLVVHAGE